MPRRLTDDLQRANDDENLLKNVSQCQWWGVGSCLWRWNQTTIHILEESCFASPQETTTGMLVSESNTACFFRSSRHCAPWIFSWRSDSYSRFLSGSSETSIGCSMKNVTCNVDCGKLLHHNNALLTQCCQLDNYWQNIQFLPFHNSPINLTSPLPTFSIP
jgi:hypothetical protein